MEWNAELCRGSTFFWLNAGYRRIKFVAHKQRVFTKLQGINFNHNKSRLAANVYLCRFLARHARRLNYIYIVKHNNISIL